MATNRELAMMRGSTMICGRAMNCAPAKVYRSTMVYRLAMVFALAFTGPVVSAASASPVVSAAPVGPVVAIASEVASAAATAAAEDVHGTLLAAQGHFEAGKFDEALKAYEQANAAEPGHAAIEYDVALCHLRLGDAEKAAQQFETLASRSGVSPALRCDALYNVGLIRGRSAREQLRGLMAPATQPSDHKPAADDPENIPKLHGIADELLRAIGAFREAVEAGGGSGAGVGGGSTEAADGDPGANAGGRPGAVGGGGPGAGAGGAAGATAGGGSGAGAGGAAGAVADAEHNIRAARITRRDVLGLLRRAQAAKEKDDILKDPRGYLEALILEQGRQAAVGRMLVLAAPQEPAEVRQARRMGLRAQRKLMETTGTFADNLEQYRESAARAPAPASAAPAPAGPASAPSTQPAEETPREKAYRAAAKQIRAAIESQRAACAHLLDDKLRPAYDQQATARDQMYAALYQFPLDPAQVLVKCRGELAQLRALVDQAKTAEDWLRDPLLAEVAPPKDTEWDADKTPLHDAQAKLGIALAMLHRQCAYVATTSQPAEEAAAQQPQQPKEPMLDPELNRKLADTLQPAVDLGTKCLTAITEQKRRPTLAAQDELLKVIDAALELLPKTLEQRVADLVLRQHQLNTDVQAVAGAPGGQTTTPAGAALDEVRQWATRFKSALLGAKPAKLAEEFNARQKTLRADTDAVNEEVRKQVPSGATAPPGAPPTSQPAEVKAYIEASKHLVEAGQHMDTAVKGFEQTVVENALKPMQPDGPVQAPQGKALEELLKALMALRPPQTQPSDDQQDQQQQQQQQRQQAQDQDKQRDVERLDREREQAERELHQRQPRTVIKDW